MLSKITLILGGAASGKSAYAESLLKNAAGRTYLATGEAYDSEMRAKIDAHIARRGPGWTTIESPLDAAGALADLTGPCLLDCATMWLTNHLLRESDLAAEETRLLDALAAARHPVVVVSNEVGHGIVPENALARQFREAQGRLNIRLAQAADSVVQVTAGLPRTLKGPE